MMITAKKGKFVDLINGLYQVKALPGKKLGLVVSKNILAIKTSLQELEDLSTPSAEFLELAAKMNEVANSGEDTVKEDMQLLEDENEELVTARKAQIEVLKEALEEDLELDLTYIEEIELPEGITAEQIMGINMIIKE